MGGTKGALSGEVQRESYQERYKGSPIRRGTKGVLSGEGVMPLYKP